MAKTVQETWDYWMDQDVSPLTRARGALQEITTCQLVGVVVVSYTEMRLMQEDPEVDTDHSVIRASVNRVEERLGLAPGAFMYDDSGTTRWILRPFLIRDEPCAVVTSVTNTVITFNEPGGPLTPKEIARSVSTLLDNARKLGPARYCQPEVTYSGTYGGGAARCPVVIDPPRRVNLTRYNRPSRYQRNFDRAEAICNAAMDGRPYRLPKGWSVVNEDEPEFRQFSVQRDGYTVQFRSVRLNHSTIAGATMGPGYTPVSVGYDDQSGEEFEG